MKIANAGATGVVLVTLIAAALGLTVSHNANAEQTSPTVAQLQDQIATLTAALKACQATNTSGAEKHEAVARSATAINRSKFEAVYRAARAVDKAQFGDVSLAQFRTLLLKFETEASIAADKAAGSAEVTLASIYHTAQLQFESGLISRDATQREASWGKASATLARADKIYLGK